MALAALINSTSPPPAIEAPLNPSAKEMA